MEKIIRTAKASGPKVVAISEGEHKAKIEAQRNALVTANLPLARSIARRIASRLPPSFDVDDLIAVANVALLRAATRYRPATHGGVPFGAFARPVITGMVLDQVRRRNYVAETMLSLTPAEDEASIPEPFTTNVVETEIDKGRLRRRVEQAITWLTREQQMVLRAYYAADEPSSAAIGERLGISESTVRLIRLQAIAALRRRLHVWRAA